MEKQVEGLLRGNQFMCLMDQQLTEVREKYDLKKLDLEVLFYISKNPDSNTARDIQKFLKINKGYISQIVDHLCKRGFLVATPDPRDRRFVHYRVSAETKDIVGEMQEVWEQIGDCIFDGVSEEEKKIFQRVAVQIQKNIVGRLRK